MKKFFEELSRRLREGGVESSNVEDRRLEIFLHGQPVLFVSPGNDVFLFPAGSNNPEASELYHRVAQTADEVYTYVEEVQTAPTLHISGLSEKFHLLADFGGAVLAGRELENGRGYQFVTWIWDYNRTGVSYGHYYDEDFCGAKQDFAVRSGLISKTQLFSPEELTELYYTLDGIKSKTVGDGQHGTARWATKQEIRQTYAHVPFEPELWRKGEHLPEKQGLVLGCEGPKDHVTALVDTDDIHAMVTAASGAGKTAFFLYPNIEYALASGMSFLCTDTKGDLFRNYAGIAKDCYGYQIAVLDLRNPTRSDGNNLLHLINKYMDIYKADPKNLAAKAKAEKYSKILAKTLINTSGGDSAQYGQNAFFYDSAEGLLTAMFLLVAEYLPTEDADGNPIEKRHIVSVFKLVQELLAPSRVKGKNQFQLLLEKLPPNHKARWFAGSALNTAEQAMASVISTVLSRLNAFLDSEMEQILCFDTAIDAEKFCNEKSAIFIVLPEEDQTKYFMVSLILQNLYREILTVADENGGRLKNRVVFFADELGTCPPIQSLELMFSASRSRGLMLVPIVQSITGQLQKNYGKEGSEIIVDNCQVNLYGGFAPASQTAVELSKSLGSRTVMSGSISRGKNDPSQSLQMMERPLMTPDELKSMPKGSFIVAKTGVHPMKVKLRLFLDWGIRFGMPYEVPEKAQRFVAYADKQELEESIIRRHYGTIVMDSEQPQGGGTSAGGMAQGIQAAPDSRKTVFRP